ncbi:MAG TPA: aldo/keto reductase [Gemmatimonadales bacterium]
MDSGARVNLGPPARLGVGAWAVGGAGWGSRGTAAERESAVRRALERGVTVFDTAPTYGDGESERLLGHVFRGSRDRVFLATKVGPKDDPRASLEASLRRLDTDHVDLVQLHEALDGWERSLETLNRLREEGKTRAVGLSNATGRQLSRAIELVPLAAYQGPLNLFDRDVEARELPLCRARGVAFLAYRPLAAGLLAGTHATPPEFPEGDHRRRIYWFKGAEFARRQAAMQRLRQLGWPLPTLAIAWALARPGVSVVLAGARTAAQVDENVAALERPLPADVGTEIDAVVTETFRLPRVPARVREAAAPWGERERFIVDRLDGDRTAEQIAAEWTDRGVTPMIAAQVKVFVDQLRERGLLTAEG